MGNLCGNYQFERFWELSRQF